MKIEELLKSGAKLNLTVNLEDLRLLIKEVMSSNHPHTNDPPLEEFLSRKEVLGKLGIDSSTLWNWEKTGYIKSFPFGGRKRYKCCDVEAIRTGKKQSR